MRPGFDIETYKSRFLGGSRQYLFFVVLTLPPSKSTGGGREETGLLSGITGGIKRMAEPVVSKYNSIIEFGSSSSSKIPGLASQLKSRATDVFSDIEGSDIANFGQQAGLQALNVFGLNRENDMVAYHVRSTSLPGITFDERTVEWPGLAFKYAGTLSYSDWTVSFNIDEDGKLLQKFNKWQSMIGNTGNGKRGSIRDYMVDQEVHLLSYSGDTTTSYKMYGCWPKTVGDTQLDYSSNELANFEVTFSYQRYDILPGPSAMVNDLIKRSWNRIMGK
jgi:hypothetical protein